MAVPWNGAYTGLASYWTTASNCNNWTSSSVSEFPDGGYIDPLATMNSVMGPGLTTFALYDFWSGEMGGPGDCANSNATIGVYCVQQDKSAIQPTINVSVGNPKFAPPACTTVTATIPAPAVSDVTATFTISPTSPVVSFSGTPQFGTNVYSTTCTISVGSDTCSTGQSNDFCANDEYNSGAISVSAPGYTSGASVPIDLQQG